MVDTSPGAPSTDLVLADRYDVVRLLARGGMGDVYEGRDRVLDRPVAVKRYRGATTVDRSRFDAEVLLLAGLNHPNLVSVYDAGEEGGDGFVVLELVDGPSLKEILAERSRLPAVEVAALGSGVADALAHVHARGIVHRDVTPSNILCDDGGTPRLTDFGIARLLDTTRVTATATTVGTAAYMAPEQVEGRDVTPAADVYALGLVLHEALTGAPGFTGTTPHEVAVARLVRDPDLAAVPPSWRPLLASMTARIPTDRPDASSVAGTLARLEAVPDEDPFPVVPIAPAAAASVVVGDQPVDPATTTQPLDRPGGGTTVMPAALLPVAGPAAPPVVPLWRRPGWILAAVAAFVLLLALVQGGGSNLTDDLVDTTEPTASTTTVAPTTTAPATTLPPPPPEEPKDEEKDEGGGNGSEGRGKGKGDDD